MDRDLDVREHKLLRMDGVELPRHEVSLERHAVQGRGYAFQLSEAELETLNDVGRFRMVLITDLARQRYQGNTEQMKDDLESLRAQNLVQIRTLWTAGRVEELTVVTLSKTGRSLLERLGTGNVEQTLYSGFVKPAELAHDTAIYRMYDAEARQIMRDGGVIRRVVLDYELKKNLYSVLAKAKSLPAAEYSRRQKEVALQNGLKVVGRKVLLPDLRIEYETRDGAAAHVDLELATHHYRGSMLRGKAEAGFKVYASSDTASRLARAFDPEFAVQIFTF